MCVSVCGDMRCVTQATAVYVNDLAAFTYDRTAAVVGLQNPAADVFSFGLVLYQLCCGDRAAWWPADVNDNDVAAITGALCHPATFAQWASVDPAGPLADVIRRCLAVRPEARPTALQLRDELLAAARLAPRPG
jgi:serine/threonine protein kinase